jgi:phosphatidylserine decarboxylase
MGRFNMGSTVILLFGKDVLDWLEEIEPGQAVKVGQTLGTRT